MDDIGIARQVRERGQGNCVNVRIQSRSGYQLIRVSRVSSRYIVEFVAALPSLLIINSSARKPLEGREISRIFSSTRRDATQLAQTLDWPIDLY